MTGICGQACPLGGAPAALAGDDFVASGITGRPHHDRLHDAVLADRLSEVGQFGLGKVAARVTRVGRQELDRHGAVGCNR